MPVSENWHLDFVFYSSIFMVSWEAETFKNFGLSRKLQEEHRISLTTPYIV